MKKAPARKPAGKPQTAAPRVVGRITPKERDEIQALYERRSGLKELIAALQQSGAMLASDALYEKVVADLGKTSTRFQKWWDDKAKAYGWENVPGCHWSIDFDTCEISLSK
jgi:CXXX repeat modification system protein